MENSASAEFHGHPKQFTAVVRIRDPVLFLPGIRNRFFRIPDTGSQTHIFNSLMTNFWVKSTINLSVLAKKKFFTYSKIKLLQFYGICGYNGRTTTKFPSPLLVLLDPGSEIRNKHPGSATLIYCFPPIFRGSAVDCIDFSVINKGLFLHNFFLDNFFA